MNGKLLDLSNGLVLLLLAEVENCTEILRADVLALSVFLCRIVDRKKYIKQV